MLDSYMPFRRQTVQAYMRRSKIEWWLMYLALLGISCAISMLLIRQGASTNAFVWAVYIGGLTAIVINPRYGIYLIVGFTLMADASLVPWYPFVKNFSSHESVLFLHDALIISPLETYIGATVVSWIGRMLMTRKVVIRQGVMFWPALTFIGFVTYGLVYGIGRRGDLVIALWEARPMYYLVAMVLLVTNLVDSRVQINRILWIAMIALFVKSLFGLAFVAFTLNFNLEGIERIAEHSMSIQFNSLTVLVLVAWLFNESMSRRLVLPFMLPTVFYAFLANHRRAGFLTLGLGVAMVVLFLYRQNRKLFMFIAPTGAVLAVLYLAAFWNSSGGLAIGAQAVRSVFGQASARDESSNVYRELENLNIMFTIKQVPLTGVGFGQKFHIAYPMADISSFIWWEYITHNSIMWMWMQIGLFGFLSMLFFVGMALLTGGRLIWAMPNGPMRAAAVLATLYVLMHFLYAYVDMSWETISMVYVGLMIGMINSLERIASYPVLPPPIRWSWQATMPSLQEAAPWHYSKPVLGERKQQL